ncbi:hypothetical protein A3J61_00425 [Candidatus Nomurabacteria bacterium RIFCSPHIGHO2_02_FULL_38_15]|uniref:Uncharacterized protein n=1 Tax=Candidatus Nomurabacteria bacterium RIFCSPHIGHO2_02_FULL_38_15 TaxID=1801752 RepID=A0A1F6VRI3_9BACT|nr:MAG: hypothetical protein A3J61_00425 [Candidatus Nomurabacteria bacterium RIFCSPHIGHO2_02_FULL_38_15]
MNRKIKSSIFIFMVEGIINPQDLVIVPQPAAKNIAPSYVNHAGKRKRLNDTKLKKPLMCRTQHK